MAKNKPTDATLIFIKISRVITYVIYAYSLLASVFLLLMFVLQLFGANYSTPFVQFVYKAGYEFLKPFRGIFPGHEVSDTSYFNSSALFGILMYMLFAVALHSLISWITAKMVAHEKELQEATEN
jgi:uncharacterized protein YggT (Ycf19 family)